MQAKGKDYRESLGNRLAVLPFGLSLLNRMIEAKWKEGAKKK